MKRPLASCHSPGKVRALFSVQSSRADSSDAADPQLPAELERIISKCVEKDRSLRYQHASDIRADLKRLKRQLDSRQALHAWTVEPIEKGRMSWRTWAMLALLALVLVLTASLLSWRKHSTAQSPSTRAMLAVLPFQNLSGDPHEDYFVDGLTEEMTAQLGELQPTRLGDRARLDRAI